MVATTSDRPNNAYRWLQWKLGPRRNCAAPNAKSRCGKSNSGPIVQRTTWLYVWLSSYVGAVVATDYPHRLPSDVAEIV